jgi:hypothetical protein
VRSWRSLRPRGLQWRLCSDECTGATKDFYSIEEPDVELIMSTSFNLYKLTLLLIAPERLAFAMLHLLLSNIRGGTLCVQMVGELFWFDRHYHTPMERLWVNGIV